MGASLDGRGTYRNDHINLVADRLGCELAQPVLAASRESVLDDEVPSLNVAELTKSLPEYPLLLLRSRGGIELDDPGDFRRLLRVGEAYGGEDDQPKSDSGATQLPPPGRR